MSTSTSIDALPYTVRIAGDGTVEVVTIGTPGPPGMAGPAGPAVITTAGDLAVGGPTGTPVRLPMGALGDRLRVKTGDTNPTWDRATMLNVRDFGASGDGVSDDTAAISAAWAAVQALGGGGAYYGVAGSRGLYFPAGVYAISAALDFAGNWLSVAGDSPALTAFLALTPEASLSFTLSRCRVGGFTFDGNNLAAKGVSLKSGTTVTIYDLYVLRCVGNGVTTSNLQNSIVDNLGSQYNGGSGLVVDDGTGSVVFRRFDLHHNNRHQLLLTRSNTVSSGYTEPSHNFFSTGLCEYQLAIASGTAGAGGSVTTLVDPGAAWTPNAYAGAWVTKDLGGAAQTGARITANTATTLTVEAGVWAAVPDGLAYSIVFPVLRAEASMGTIFDNCVIVGGIGDTPIIHLTRALAGEAQAAVELRSTLIGGAGSTRGTGVEITGDNCSFRADPTSTLLGFQRGIRFNGGSASRLLGSVPTLNNVTTPVVFVTGTMNANAVDTSTGTIKRWQPLAPTDDLLRLQVLGEANYRLLISGAGTINHGGGTAPTDLSIARAAGGNYQITGQVRVSKAIWHTAYSTKSGNYTVLPDDQLIIADATAGNMTITLTTVAGNAGKIIQIKRIDGSANFVRVAAPHTMDGVSQFDLRRQWETVSLQNNGATWHILSRESGIPGVASATLDVASIPAHTCDESKTIAVPGAAVGDTVYLGPPAALEAGLIATGIVSAAGTVKLRLCNITASPIDPASATWTANVFKAINV